MLNVLNHKLFLANWNIYISCVGHKCFLENNTNSFFVSVCDIVLRRMSAKWSIQISFDVVWKVHFKEKAYLQISSLKCAKRKHIPVYNSYHPIFEHQELLSFSQRCGCELKIKTHFKNVDRKTKKRKSNSRFGDF